MHYKLNTMHCTLLTIQHALCTKYYVVFTIVNNNLFQFIQQTNRMTKIRTSRLLDSSGQEVYCAGMLEWEPAILKYILEKR